MTLSHRVSVGSRVVLAAGLTAIGLWPAPAPAKATEETATIPNIAESWYVKLGLPPLVEGQPETPDIELPDVCDLLAMECEPVAIPNPGVPGLPSELPDDVAELVFPAETLHVEMNANRPVSRAFVVPNFSLIPDAATITAAQMVLPVSEDPLAMNNAVATARFEGCLVTSAVPDGEQGRLSKAPDFDCEAARSPAVYDAKGNLFTVDLMPLVEKWTSGAENFGVALVPAVAEDPAAAADPGSTFHVGINGSDVKGDAAGAESLITFTVPAEVEEPNEEPVSTGGGGGTTPSTGGGIVTPEPPPAAEPAPVDAPEAEVPATEALEPAPYSLINAPWYTYRGVVFLPLAFLVAISLTGRALTRPLTAARTRRA